MDLQCTCKRDPIGTRMLDLSLGMNSFSGLFKEYVGIYSGAPSLLPS